MQMWIQIDTEAFEKVGADYIAQRIAWYSDLNNANAAKFRDAAKTAADEDHEVDDDAVVSVSDDGGAYVMCWQWVSNEEAGIGSQPHDLCDECGRADVEIALVLGSGKSVCVDCAGAEEEAN